MSSGWKYIMFEVELPVDPRLENTRANPMTSCKIPVIFPPEITHVAMMRATARAINDDRKFAKPISAGFVRFMSINTTAGIAVGAHVYGRSESLSMEFNPDDRHIINAVAERNPFYYPEN